ncbi:MAG TPA: YitT family protein [Candidatus Coprenecus pullistercoris]|nr:YitT family protein [Candidatus Coprenecus pullistercoris]
METQKKPKRTGSRKALTVVNDYLIITIGLLCYTAGWCIFILPHGIVGGGVSGIGAIVSYVTGKPEAVSYTFFLVNAVLLVIGIKTLGKAFGVKTVYAVFVASLLFRVWPEIIPESFIDSIALENSKLLCALIGGAMSGLGIGMAFSRGGSTAGTDVIALIVSKYRNIPPGRIILLCDIFIVGSSIFLHPELSIGERVANIVYGYIVVAACSYVVDLSVAGNKQSVQLFIFSKQYKEIADMISGEMHRGVTVLDAQGWYTKQDEKVLLVMVRKVETNYLLSVIKRIDKQAFISVGNVMGVYGRGFDAIKEKKKIAKI